MVQTNKGVGDTVTLQGLMKMINNINDRLRSIKEEWLSRARRPVPVRLYIWSEQGGLGKTEFVRRLAQVMKSRVKGFNDRVYSIQPAAVHFARYYGEHTMHYNEVGGLCNTDKKTSPFTQSNNILLGNTVPMPSTSLGGKHQIPKPHLVVMTSICDIRHVDTKLSDTARRALISRMLVYDFCDDNFDPMVKDAGQTQPHRQPDFSHIRFRIEDEELTVDELADVICEKLGSSLENYRALSETPLPTNHYVYNGKPLTVDKNFSADATKFLHWFAGNLGTGKSRTVLPYIRELTSMIKVGYHAPNNLSELQAIKPAVGDVFVIDDLFDLALETHQLLFIQWYNALPSMCKVICLSNYGPDSINPFSTLYRLRKYYRPLDVSSLKPAMPRWIGFTISDEARCLVKTNGGWKDLNGQEFQLDHVLCDWVRANSRAAYPSVLDKMPDILPFTTKEADIWFETNKESPGLKTILSGIMKSCSFRTMKMLAGFDVDEFDVSSMGSTISQFPYLATKKLDKPKIYVRIASRSWYYCDGTMFNGSENHPALKVKTWMPLRIITRDCVCYVTDKQIQEVHQGETPYETDSAVFLVLSREMKCAIKAWERIYLLYPPSTETVNCGYNSIILRVAKAIKGVMYH